MLEEAVLKGLFCTLERSLIFEIFLIIFNIGTFLKIVKGFGLFLYILKTFEKPWFSDVCRGYKKRPQTLTISTKIHIEDV